MHRTQQQVTCLRRLQSDASGFLVADLSHENDVGILPQDGAQASRERDSCPRIDLYLIHSVKLVLNGIFDRDDILGR
jgi:hypothetical protein